MKEPPGVVETEAVGREQNPRAAPARPVPWRALRVTGIGAALCGVAFALGFGVFASYVGRLRTPPNPPTADAIIVLTGGQSRLDAALGLLKSGKGKRLLISGVHPAAGRNALQAVTGVDEDLFRCCVDIDHKALDTVGNAEESAKWIGSHAYASVILVTNNYHMPRSLLEMSRYLSRTELKPYPVVNTPLDHGEWLMKPQALRVLFTEYTKYVAALARAAVHEPGIGGLDTVALGTVRDEEAKR